MNIAKMLPSFGAVKVVACALVGIFLVLGCAGASGPRYSAATAPADEAVIYVYRPSAAMGRERVFAVCLDGDGTPAEAPSTCTNVIRNGGYFTLKTPPGIHRVWVFKGKSVDVNVEAGKSYYLRFYPLGETLDAVAEKDAMSDLHDCKLSQVNQ